MFEEGEKVKIRENLELKGNDRICPGVNPEMMSHKGKTTTIIEKGKFNAKPGVKYLLKIDNGKWNWTNQMIKKLTRIKLR